MSSKDQKFYRLKYGNYHAWIACLGSTTTSEIVDAGDKQEISEYRSTKEYLANWKPNDPWTPPPVTFIVKEGRRNLLPCDRVFSGPVGPYFSERAVERLQPILEASGSILPLNVTNSDRNYFIWIVPVIENSVNPDLSTRNGSSKSKELYSLNASLVQDKVAFRPHAHGETRAHYSGRVLVSDEFKNAWLDASLTGIEFAVGTV